eukprot:8596259-Alexandrium_andersonii.AAC.1
MRFASHASFNKLLEPLSIKGVMPGCRTWPALTQADLDMLSKHMIYFRSGLPAGWSARLVEGDLWLRPASLAMAAQPPWRTSAGHAQDVTRHNPPMYLVECPLQCGT